MDVVYRRCCGLDVHKRSVAACRMVTRGNGHLEQEIRTFETTTEALLELGDWLAEAGVTHVAMESTGVYWKPIWNLLEDRFTLWLVNAAHVKAVPGRKTDVRDCAWLAELLRHGLLQPSFVPDRPERELRELTRYRASLVHERTAEVNRLQKTLEGANIKLPSVVSDMRGVSARAMLDALVGGETDSAVLAGLARGSLRHKQEALRRALHGRMGAHQRFLVSHQLSHLDFLDAQIDQLSREIAERLGPFDELLVRLDTIPGVGRWTAEVLVAEIGTDMSRFPTDGHLASWAGMCPGHHESAGKRQRGTTRKGPPWLRTALTEAAYAAGRSKNTYLSAQYHRLVVRRGRKKATIAVGHSILVIAYHLIARGATYQDLGPDFFTRRSALVEQHRLVERLEALGHQVTLQPLAA
jgi:transposase